jgi:hypothetical protein
MEYGIIIGGCKVGDEYAHLKALGDFLQQAKGE